MGKKIVMTLDHDRSTEQLTALKQQVADALGVLPDDVVYVRGVSLQVVDVPDDLAGKRQKADREAEKKAAQEKADAEKAEAARLEADWQKAAQEKADRVTPHGPTAETPPPESGAGPGPSPSPTEKGPNKDDVNKSRKGQ